MKSNLNYSGVLNCIKKYYYLIALSLILVIAVLLRNRFFMGMVRWDSFRYCENAYDIMSGSFVNYDNFFGVYRLAIIIPLIGFFKIFGVKEFSASLVPVLYSLGSIVMTFLIGKELFNKRVGLIASFMLSIFAMEVLLSTQLLPDVVLPFFLAVSVYSFIKGEKGKGKEKRIYFLLAGVGIQLGMYAREISFVLLGFFAVYVIFYKRKGWKDYLFSIYGFILSGIIGMIIVWVIFGNPFNKISTLYLRAEHGVFTMEHIIRCFKNLNFDFLNIMISDKRFACWYLPIIVVTAIMLIFRERKARMILLWFLFLYVYMELPGSLILRKHGRYLMILNVPGALILGYFLGELWKKKNWIKWSIIILFVMSMGIQYQIMDIYYKRNNIKVYEFREPYKYVGTLPEKKIFFCDWDPRYNFFLKYATPYKHGMRKGGARKKKVDVYFKKYILKMDMRQMYNIKQLHRIRDAYIIWKPSRVRGRGVNDIIPEDWEVLREFRKYSTRRARDVIVYYAPDREQKVN